MIITAEQRVSRHEICPDRHRNHCKRETKKLGNYRPMIDGISNEMCSGDTTIHTLGQPEQYLIWHVSHPDLDVSFLSY